MLEDVGEAGTLVAVQLRKATHGPARHQQRLERPDRPVGHHGHPMRILQHEALTLLPLHFDVLR